jgi:hypothetical protein
MKGVALSGVKVELLKEAHPSVVKKLAEHSAKEKLLRDMFKCSSIA